MTAPDMTAPAAAAPGPPAAASFVGAAPVVPPFGDARSEDATRWWLLSVLCVLLPAALAAAYPRGTGRHS
jgi:hypothetical protein